MDRRTRNEILAFCLVDCGYDEYECRDAHAGQEQVIERSWGVAEGRCAEGVGVVGAKLRPGIQEVCGS